MEKCVVFCVLLLCFIVCSAVELTFHVDEEQDRGTLVGRISDSSDLQKLLSAEVLGSLKYSFLVQGYPRSVLFTIVNNTGLVYTAQKLDRELLCGFSDTCILDLEVAVQSTISQFFRKERVKVVLNDINDNRPEFTSSSINVEISESVSVNSSYQLEAAVDRDVGNNSLKGYELVSNSDIFDLRTVQTLDGGSVVSLVVTKSLDREKRDRYNVTVVARDGGSPSMSSSLSVIIKIKDVNDNPPVFSSPTFNVTVTETSPVNTVVVTLTATDADTPPNGVAFYRFSPLLRGGVTDYFRINETTGVLSVRSSLNDIQGKTMKGVVECLDHGSPPLIAQALVIINIEDTTNNRPSINLNLLADGEVSEYAQPGTPVAHIAVLDPDTGRNGIVRCSLISNAFELQGLDVDEYKIIVARTVDRELESSFNVTLTCFDAGDPPMNRSIVFPVHVKDENDNSPIFSRGEYLANITENNDIGEVILQVSASDLDTGLNSKLRFFSPEGDKLGVSVNANGQIIAERKFDREVEPNLRFKVFAADMGQLSRTSNTLVEITILDVNDATPTFSTSTYVFSVFENQKSNTAIGTVTAHDGDEGANKQVQYSIFREKSDDRDIPFSITPSGEILTTRPLDREKKRRYEFVVVATDGGETALHGSATVIVDIEDENDNKPVITYPTMSNHSVALSYLTPPNALILAVTATDDDWGDNSRVSYHIAPGTDQKLFLVDGEIGLVKTRRALTTADIGLHKLFIQVKDGGQPSQVTNVTIKIDIVVSNETMLSSKDNEENTLVVIILGTLTGVIAVAVIITIVIIRRIDNRKKHEQDMLTANQTTINPDDVMKLSGPHYVIKSGDVSFDSTHSSSINGSNDSADKLLRERETDLQDNSRQLSSISGGKLVSFGPNQEWPTAVKLHKDLLKLHHIEFKDSNLGIKRSDDANSDTSGEITGTDSGRGGSEEDSHSNGHPSPPIPKRAPRKNIKPKPPSYPQHIENQKKHSITSDFSSVTGEDLSYNKNKTLPPVPPRRQPMKKHVSFQSDFCLGSDVGSRDSFRNPAFANFSSVAYSVPSTADHSFDAEDDNTTTTSGSYMVDLDNEETDFVHSRMKDVVV